MAKWWKTDAGAYVNSDFVCGMYPFLKNGNWVIRVHHPAASLTSGAPAEADLAGTYTTEAETKDAMARLVQGFDTSLI